MSPLALKLNPNYNCIIDPVTTYYYVYDCARDHTVFRHLVIKVRDQIKALPFAIRFQVILSPKPYALNPKP